MNLEIESRNAEGGEHRRQAVAAEAVSEDRGEERVSVGHVGDVILTETHYHLLQKVEAQVYMLRLR